MNKRRDGGYVLVAAAAALALFSVIAFALLAGDRGLQAGLAADMARARLRGAADAGLALAIHHLAIENRAQRWSIDGRLREFSFDGMVVTVAIEDEAGKIAVNHADPQTFRKLLDAAGVSGDRLALLTSGFADWLSPVEKSPLASSQNGETLEIRRGQFWSLGELAHLPGMDTELWQRIAPALTLYHNDRLPFSKTTAQPLALMAMLGPDSPENINRQRELSGQRPALEITDDISLASRPLTVRLTARDNQGGRLTRRVVIEFSRTDMRAYEIREAD